MRMRYVHGEEVWILGEHYDVITLTGLTVSGVHGVLPSEQTHPQRFTIDVSMWVDMTTATLTDSVTDTVSYADVAHVVAQVVRGPSARLIETLAARVADRVLEDPRVRGVEVTVHKPDAPIDEAFADVSVTIARGEVPERSRAKVLPESLKVTQEIGGHVVSVSGSAAEQVVAVAEVLLHGHDEDAPHTAPVPLRSRVKEHRHEEASSLPATWVHAVLALGGNIGDVPSTLREVIEVLVSVAEVEVREVSPLLRTEAVLTPNQDPQDDYWNAVILLRTCLTPDELLELTATLEETHGRVREEHWGPRTLDIDIIQIEGVRREDDRLTLPHPRAHERAFVLAPWILVDPDAQLDGYGAVSDLLEQATDREGIRDAVEDWLEDPASVIADSDEHLRQDEQSHHGETTRHEAAEASDEFDHETRPTRLDRLPSQSRSGLAPVTDTDDLLWRQLWQRWADEPEEQVTHEPEACQEQEPQVCEEPALVDQTPEAPTFAEQFLSLGTPPSELPIAQDVVSANEYETLPDEDEPEVPALILPPVLSPPPLPHAAPAVDTFPVPQAVPAAPPPVPVFPSSFTTLPPAPPAGEAPPQPPAVTPSQETDETVVRIVGGRRAENVEDTPAPLRGVPPLRRRRTEDPSLHQDRASRRPRWLPLAAKATPSSEQESFTVKSETQPWLEAVTDVRKPQRNSSQLGVTQVGQALPSWQFDQSHRRIVDEADATRSTALAPARLSTAVLSPANDSSPVRRSVLDPGLPRDLPRGPLGEESVSTSVQRKVTVRPTVTGQIPIIRRGDGVR